VITIGEEYAKAKLQEDKFRLEEMEFLNDELELVESVENKFRQKEYQEKVLALLEEKSKGYMKIIDNNMKLKCQLTNSTLVT